MRALVAVALLCAGCPAGLEEQSHVSKLRVLAVKAEPAELILQADAGLPSTTLTALAIDPSGAPISMKFALCADLSGVPSPTLDCPGDAGLDLPDAGPLSARLDLADPRIVAFAAGAAAQVDGGSFDAAVLDQGVSLLVGFDADTAAATLAGFATVTLRTDARGPANVNPQLLDLEIPDAGPGQTVRLQPITAQKDDPAKHYGFSFFATDGSISSLRSTDITSTGQSAPTWVEWTAPNTPGATVHFWVVLRDGRGGTDWIERDALVH